MASGDAKADEVALDFLLEWVIDPPVESYIALHPEGLRVTSVTGKGRLPVTPRTILPFAIWHNEFVNVQGGCQQMFDVEQITEKPIIFIKSTLKPQHTKNTLAKHECLILLYVCSLYVLKFCVGELQAYPHC